MTELFFAVPFRAAAAAAFLRWSGAIFSRIVNRGITPGTATVPCGAQET